LELALSLYGMDRKSTRSASRRIDLELRGRNDIFIQWLLATSGRSIKKNKKKELTGKKLHGAAENTVKLQLRSPLPSILKTPPSPDTESVPDYIIKLLATVIAL